MSEWAKGGSLFQLLSFGGFRVTGNGIDPVHIAPLPMVRIGLNESPSGIFVRARTDGTDDGWTHGSSGTG